MSQCNQADEQHIRQEYYLPESLQPVYSNLQFPESGIPFPSGLYPEFPIPGKDNVERLRRLYFYASQVCLVTSDGILIQMPIFLRGNPYLNGSLAFYPDGGDTDSSFKNTIFWELYGKERPTGEMIDFEWSCSKERLIKGKLSLDVLKIMVAHRIQQFCTVALSRGPHDITVPYPLSCTHILFFGDSSEFRESKQKYSFKAAENALKDKEKFFSAIDQAFEESKQIFPQFKEFTFGKPCHSMSHSTPCIQPFSVQGYNCFDFKYNEVSEYKFSEKQSDSPVAANFSVHKEPELQVVSPSPQNQHHFDEESSGCSRILGCGLFGGGVVSGLAAASWYIPSSHSYVVSIISYLHLTPVGGLLAVFLLAAIMAALLAYATKPSSENRVQP